jgi:cobalt-zinc-cadmium resistance protein CzcA
MMATCGALGFVPMAISGSAGAEVQHPSATVVIGGLITCMIRTLLLLPTIYRWFEPKEPSEPPHLSGH